MKFTLMDTFDWSPEYIESLRMWEFDVYVDMLNKRLEKEEKERKKES